MTVFVDSEYAENFYVENNFIQPQISGLRSSKSRQIEPREMG